MSVHLRLIKLIQATNYLEKERINTIYHPIFKDKYIYNAYNISTDNPLSGTIYLRGDSMEMDEKDMEEKKNMILNMCICRKCPSWIECNEKGGYCFSIIKKSKCITKENGCICSGCPVTANMGLKHIYFCTKGSEKEQSNM